MKRYDINFVSEITNGNYSLAALMAFAVCVFYLGHELRARRGLEKQWTIGMSVARDIALISAATFGSRFLIFVWRHIYHSPPFTGLELDVLVLTGLVGVAGFISLARTLSRPLFGEWVWLATVGGCLLFSVYDLIY